MRSKATILGLMGAVVAIAIALTALRDGSETWSIFILLVTLLLLCTATLVAIYRRGAWAGFAVFGWAMFLVCQPNYVPHNGTAPFMVVVVYKAAVLVDTAISPTIPSLNGPGDRVTFDQVRVVLCLLSLAFGCLGAASGRFIGRGLGESDEEASEVRRGSKAR
jgi:hypothetical protein